MKVKELIRELQTKHQDACVVVDGYEDGLDDISKVEEIKIEKNVNTVWWNGKHERIDSDAPLNKTNVRAVHLY